MNTTTELSEFNMTIWRDFIEDSIIVSDDFKVVYTVVMCIVIAIGVSVNLLISIVIYFDKTMHTVTNYYLFSLAISDMALTFVLIFVLHEQLSGTNFSEIACKIQYFGLMSLWNYSVLTMTALSIERYVAVCHPLKINAHKNLRRVIKIIAVMWLVAAAESGSELMNIELVKVEPGHLLICFSVPTAYARVMSGVLAVITFFIPLLIIICAYSMIFLKVNLIRRKDLLSGASNQRSPRGKINKLIVVMTVAFLICWMPHFFLRILFAVREPNELNKETKWWTLIFKLIAISGWFCVILNPVIFSIASTKFRRSLKELWNTKVLHRVNS